MQQKKAPGSTWACPHPGNKPTSQAWRSPGWRNIRGLITKLGWKSFLELDHHHHHHHHQHRCRHHCHHHHHKMLPGSSENLFFYICSSSSSSWSSSSPSTSPSLSKLSSPSTSSSQNVARLKNLFFYILFGLEQAGLVAAWYLATHRWPTWLAWFSLACHWVTMVFFGSSLIREGVFCDCRPPKIHKLEKS